MTWNDPGPAEVVMGSPNGDDPVVILRCLADRGICLEGLSAEKTRLRLRLCVKQDFISLVQSVTVREHLLGP